MPKTAQRLYPASHCAMTSVRVPTLTVAIFFCTQNTYAMIFICTQETVIIHIQLLLRTERKLVLSGAALCVLVQLIIIIIIIIITVVSNF
jgi:hypothetical protein